MKFSAFSILVDQTCNNYRVILLDHKFLQQKPTSDDDFEICLQKQAWHSKTDPFLAKNMLQLEQSVHYMNELRLQRWQNGHFKESFASTRYFLPFQKRQRLTSTYLSCSLPLLLLDEKGNKKVTANFLNSTAHFTTKCSNLKLIPPSCTSARSVTL